MRIPCQLAVFRVRRSTGPMFPEPGARILRGGVFAAVILRFGEDEARIAY
jgi:hypothetical protein